MSTSPDGAAFLQQRFLQSAAWTAGSRGLMVLLGLGVTAVLARLLEPADYGLMGMAMVFVGLLNMARNLGIAQAVVQRPHLSENTKAQAFTLSLLISLALFALTWVLAPLMALAYNEPRLIPLVRVLGAGFILNAFHVLPQALLRRELRLRGEALSRTLSQLGDSVVTIALAWLGFGVWALVAGTLVNGLMFALALARYAPWRPVLRLRGGEGRLLLRFGSGVTASSFLWYFYSNADFFIIGRLLGTRQLGLYTMAWTLAKMPWSQLWIALNPAVLPLFSRSRLEAGGMARPFLRLHRVMVTLAFPLLAGLAMVAEDAVRLLLGSQWEGVAGPLQWLCVFGVFYSAGLLLSPLLLAAGRVGREASFNIACAAVFPVAFWLAAPRGAIWVAAVWAFLYPVLAAAVLLPPALRVSGATLGQFMSGMLRPALAMGGMTVAVWLAGLPEGLSAAARLVLRIGTGGLAYVLLLRLLEGPALLATVRSTLTDAFGRSPRRGGGAPSPGSDSSAAGR